LDFEELLLGQLRPLSAANEAKRRGSGGRPPKLAAEPFTESELAALKHEILEGLCDHDAAECPDCSLEGGPNDPEIFEIVREIPSPLQQCPLRLQL